MKTQLTVKRVLSLVAVMLAAVMLFTGCGSKNTASNGSDFTSEEEQTQITSSEENQENVNSEDKTGSNNSKSNKNNSKANATTGKNNSKTTTTKTGKTTFNSDPYSDISSEVKSKSVHILMWRKYLDQEQQLIDGFEKKTGIKVRTTVTTETEYSTKLISMISGGDAPDVISLGTNVFPGLYLRSAQPLDKETFRLDDSFWYKDYMDPFKVNGNYYCVSSSGSWNSEDTAYVAYYMPKVLKTAGITEDPWELYKKGQWNWDKQKEMAKKIVNAGKGYVGVAYQTHDLPMYSAGADFVSYDGKQFKSELESISGNSLLVKSWQYAATLKSDGLSGNWEINLFQQNKVGFFNTLTYGMQKGGGYISGPSTSSDVRVVPVAGPKGSTTYLPSRPKTWGVAKEAKNVEGAAYFLRYFLDPTNIDMKSTFLNEQFYEVFQTITAKSFKRKIMRATGIVDYTNSGTYHSLQQTISSSTPEQIVQALNSNKSKIDTGIKKANKDLKKVKASS